MTAHQTDTNARTFYKIFNYNFSKLSNLWKEKQQKDLETVTEALKTVWCFGMEEQTSVKKIGEIWIESLA